MKIEGYSLKLCKLVKPKHITIGNWLNIITYPYATNRDNDITRWLENKNIFRTKDLASLPPSFTLFLRILFGVMLQHDE